MGAESESQGRIADLPFRSAVLAGFSSAVRNNPAELGPPKLKWTQGIQLRAICSYAGGSMLVCKSAMAKKTYFWALFAILNGKANLNRKKNTKN